MAQLQIRTGDVLFTRVEDTLSKTTRPHIYVSAYPLALWIAANWWRLHVEVEVMGRSSVDWQMAHTLSAAGGGYAWPGLQLIPDGEKVLVSGVPLVPDPASPVRYLDGGAIWVEAASASYSMHRFVEAVTDRLSGFGLSETPLHALWRETLRECQDPLLRERRELEARMGYDPEEAPEQALTATLSLARSTGHQAANEVAMAYQHHTAERLNRLWEQKEEATPVHLPGKMEAYPPHLVPWERGALCARWARQQMGDLEGPLSNDMLNEWLGADVMTVGRSDSSALAPAGYCLDTTRIVASKRHPHSRRFEVARIVGDIIGVGSDDPLRPVTYARTARQKFQRAFAQEFLAPSDEVVRVVEHRSSMEEGIEEASEHYDVSPLVIQYVLERKGLLPLAARDLAAF